MRILHTAYLHLQSASDVRWSALESVVAQASNLQADALTIAGDLFDRDVDAHELRAALREVFERFEGTVILIAGNHDAKGIREGDHFGENVKVITSIECPVDVDDVRFVGIPFAEGDVEATLVRLHEAGRQIRREATNVLLFHGELLHIAPGASAFGDEDGRDYMPVQLSSFESLGFDYVLAGHFHSTQRVLDVGKGYFVYPGSPVSITRKETGKRRACLVEMGSAPEAVELETRHFKTVDIHAQPERSAELIATIEGSLRDLDPLATAILTVSGLVNLREIALTEELFAEALKRIAAEFNAIVGESKWRDVGEVIDTELFRKLEAKLAAGDFGDEERSEIREMLLASLMEVEYAH